MGIHLVKRLRLLDDAKKQAAEVATYFSQFDEAEKIYRELDRRDLALQLRANLGDWTKVVQLVQQGGGDDTKLRNAWDRMGDQCLERGELGKAAGYYAQAQNMPALAECLYRSEAYAGLVKLATDLPDGTPLLVDIGRMLSSVGMSSDAVDAFVKGGDVPAAIDSCLMQHKFDSAVELAERHNFPGVQKALAQYAGKLIDSGKKLQAVELYSKASQYTEAAKLLTRIAADVGASRSNPQRAKKLFVAAALEVERMRKQMLDSKAPQGGTQTAAQTLESLVTQVRLAPQGEARSGREGRVPRRHLQALACVGAAICNRDFFLQGRQHPAMPVSPPPPPLSPLPLTLPARTLSRCAGQGDRGGQVARQRVARRGGLPLPALGAAAAVRRQDARRDADRPPAPRIRDGAAKGGDLLADCAHRLLRKVLRPMLPRLCQAAGGWLRRGEARRDLEGRPVHFHALLAGRSQPEADGLPLLRRERPRVGCSLRGMRPAPPRLYVDRQGDTRASPHRQMPRLQTFLLRDGGAWAAELPALPRALTAAAAGGVLTRRAARGGARSY
jgi:tetratricopeptide (TPR) repeat protein